MVKIIGWMN